MGGGVSKTVTHRPAARPEAAGPPDSCSVVDLAEFQRSIVEIGLIDAEELARFVVTPDEVSRLAGALIRAARLTAYQAAALAQGKTKGLLIGDYLVLDKLGQGGMGVVFKARHRPTGQVVAMKILPPSFGRDREAVQRFRREVEIASRLDHPNVVAALDASEIQGVHFLAMEYISGYDLDQLVTEGGPLPVELALHCAIHAARGLAAAHPRGIIHRDVKPANVMLDDKGSVRVLDLGLARVVEAGNLIGGSPVGSLTQSGAYMGTVDFMAPEQADDPRKVDHRADIYSLGCTLYFLLTGRPPFLGDTVLKRLMAHQERPAPSLRAARPEVSEELEAGYLAMMAKRAAERPDSMAEVIDHLEACRSSPENEEEARSGLTIFANRAFKRAVPRGRDRGPDASIFARRPKTEGLRFDPDLRFEDVVMDLREERRPEPLTEEKLLPIVSRPLPKRVRRRRSSVPYGLIGLVLIGLIVAGYAFRPQTKQDSPEPAQPRAVAVVPTPERPAPAPMTPKAAAPEFRPLFNGKDIAGWSIDGDDKAGWSVEDGALVARGADWKTRNYLITDREYGDFELRLDVALDRDTGSGVGLRARPGEKVPLIDGTASFDHPIFKLTDGPGRDPGGTMHWVFDRMIVPPDTPAEMKPAGEWNHVVLEMRGRRILASINGRTVQNQTLDAGARFPDGTIPALNRPRGRIGLQKLSGTVRFRNIEVKELTASTSAANSEFRSLFNGKHLSGWHGLKTMDPRTFEALSGAEKAKALEDGASDLKKHWRVENGVIINDGQGAYFTSDKDYGDIELLVDFKIGPKGDSGVYLRGMPQIQIWDFTEPSYARMGADKGSGGLWNNSLGSPGKDPLVRADNPVGQWNTFRVIQVGARTTVYLNDKLVVDHALLENYWDRANPIPPRGPIQLQSHGSEIRWRNIKVREIPADEANAILAKHGAEGFTSIFNDHDLTGWAGAVDDYEVVGGILCCKPGKRAVTIYEPVERRDFVARVEFRLAPGAESGMEMRYPGQGNGAFTGMCEIQILDDTHPSCANLDARLFNGSAYGMAAAKRGHLRPLGEWNVQEVTVRGSTVKVELNGVVVLNADLAAIRDFDDGRSHPGKDRTSGYFGIQSGPGTNQGSVQYRKIEIRDLATSATTASRSLFNESDEPTRPTQATLDGTGPGWKELTEEDFINVNCDPRTWSWRDGVLHGTGQPDGVIRTRKPFTNFELVAQWRVLRSGGSSGIVVWTKEEFLTGLKPGAYMRGGIEVQILDHGFTEQYEKKTGKKADWFTTHGDVFPVGSSRMRPFAPVSPDGTRSFPSKRLSKGVNEWNHYYMRCIDGEIRLWVNGEQVSGGSGCDPASGYLCLESESSRPVEFRRLRIRELP